MYIGLRNDNGSVEYNARFLLGDERAEALEPCCWYKYNELLPAFWLETQNKDSKHKWRKVDIDGN